MARPRPLVNLNGQVTEILALKILHGEYAAEQSLPPEKDLHEVSGVSRTTLREAVKNLSAKGLVTVGPSRGTGFVQEPSGTCLTRRCFAGGWSVASP